MSTCDARPPASPRSRRHSARLTRHRRVPSNKMQDSSPSTLYDRRGFLRTTAGGGAAIVIASLLPAGCSTDYPQAATDGWKLHALTDKEYAIARAAAEAMLIGVPVTIASVAQ